MKKEKRELKNLPFFKFLVFKRIATNIQELTNINNIKKGIKSLINDYESKINYYLDNMQSKITYFYLFEHFKNQLSCINIINLLKDESFDHGDGPQPVPTSETVDGENPPQPEMILFEWALVMNRIEIAELFWRRGQV